MDQNYNMSSHVRHALATLYPSGAQCLLILAIRFDHQQSFLPRMLALTCAARFPYSYSGSSLANVLSISPRHLVEL